MTKRLGTQNSIKSVRSRSSGDQFHLTIKLGLVPREALVEMIAGTYNGAAGDCFGSMGALVLLAETPISEKFT
jgi:hypothetical protein